MSHRQNVNRIGKRDENEPEFTEYFRAAHIKYRLLPPKFGADVLVLMSPMWFLEIKSPLQAPSDRRLTPDEVDLQTHCEAEGVSYLVALCVDQVNEFVTEARK